MRKIRRAWTLSGNLVLGVWLVGLFTFATNARGVEPARPGPIPIPVDPSAIDLTPRFLRPATVADSIRAGLKIVEKGATNYPNHRECFSCHHQTMPMFAIAEADQAGIAADLAVIDEQAKFSLAFFRANAQKFEAGSGIGGKSVTTVYGLWALAIAEHAPDDITDAMASYLLKNQKEDVRWEMHSNIRPPMVASHEMCTVLGVYGLRRYRSERHQVAIESAISRARVWLEMANGDEQEDVNARLWGWKLFEDSARIATARDTVLARQLPDGSWSQRLDMTGDAYSTGQSLWVLSESGFDTRDPRFRKGVDYLLRTQREGGEWFVETRAKPVQKFFDNGDPHGKHQFIVVPATSWAVAALARAEAATKGSE